MRRVLGAFVGVILLGLALGVHPIVEWRDLACPAGTVGRPVGIAYWAVRCEPYEASTQASTVPVSRYVGLFLMSVSVRVFEVDFTAGSVHGPSFASR